MLMHNELSLKDKTGVKMSRNWIITALTAIVLLVAILLAIDLHRTGKQEVTSQFQEHQLSHAQHLAHQIESFFKVNVWRLQTLSTFLLFHYSRLKGEIPDI